MLKSCDALQPTGGVIEGRVEAGEGWSVLSAGPPFDVGIRELRLFLGDKESGPIVWLLHFPRFEFPPDIPRPESIEAPTHRHRSPTWRMSLGDGPRQTLIDHRWLGQHDWFLLDANQRYSEQVGVDGAQNVLVFADRRGIPSMYKDTEALDAQALIDLDAQVYGSFGDGLLGVHTRDEDAACGVAITAGEEKLKGGRTRGSLGDQSGWQRLADGSAVAASFLAGTPVGPVVMMSRNAPNTLEAPAGRYSTDMFRLVVEGSCRVGERTYRSHEFVATAADVAQGPVVHGPEGSTQVVILADSGHWRPLADDGVPAELPRLTEMASLLVPHTHVAGHLGSAGSSGKI